MQRYQDEDEPETFTIASARFIKQTTKAFIVSAPMFPTTVVIPESVIHDDSEVYSMKSAGPGDLVVTRWFAEKRGWVEEGLDPEDIVRDEEEDEE